MTDSTTPVVVTPTPWYMSKTLWLGAVTAALGLLDFIQTLPLPHGLLTVIGGAVMFLRFVTTGPLSSK